MAPLKTLELLKKVHHGLSRVSALSPCEESYLQFSSPSGVSGLGSNAIAVHRSCSYFWDFGQSGSSATCMTTSP